MSQGEYGAEFLSPRDIATKLRVSVKTVIRAIQAGDLPAVKVGSQWRVKVTDFQAWTGA